MLRCEWKHRKYQCFLTLVKKHCKLQYFWPPDPQKPWYLQWFFCFSPRKNTVNNSNFAVFSCFSLFFELRWSAIHGYQILRVFFSDNQYFRMFLVSMADIIGSYDAVRAVAVAKRREYLYIWGLCWCHGFLLILLLVFTWDLWLTNTTLSRLVFHYHHYAIICHRFIIPRMESAQNSAIGSIKQL